MGSMAYVGWAVLMATAILFSTLLGIFLGEWKGTSNRTKSLLAGGLAMLVVSSVVAGYSSYLGQDKTVLDKTAKSLEQVAPAVQNAVPAPAK
jgi:L-rhamnose-H+ transport protein